MTQVHGLSARHVCRLPALVAAVATLILGTVPAHAQEPVKDAPSTPVVLTQPGPLDLVKASVTRALAISQSQADAAQQRVEIRQVGEALFDFNEMSRRALARHWADRSPQEQEEFVRLFTDLLERSYLAAMGNRLPGRVHRGFVGAGPVTLHHRSRCGDPHRVSPAGERGTLGSLRCHGGRCELHLQLPEPVQLDHPELLFRRALG